MYLRRLKCKTAFRSKDLRMWIETLGRSQRTCVLFSHLHLFAFSWIQSVNLLWSLPSCTSRLYFNYYSISTLFVGISKKKKKLGCACCHHCLTTENIFPSLNIYSLAYDKPHTLWPLSIMCGNVSLFLSLEYQSSSSLTVQILLLRTHSFLGYQ